MIKRTLLAMALCATYGHATAGEALNDLSNWQYGLPKQAPVMQLSQTDIVTTGGGASADQGGMIEYRHRNFTGNQIHKYLGIGSIGSALIAAASPKEYDGAHENFADLAAGLGVGAVITGLLFHFDEIELSNGISDPDNLHMALTTLGTLGYLAAVDDGGESGHAGLGVGGFLSMGIGIKMVW